jgi:capsid portal protein
MVAAEQPLVEFGKKINEEEKVYSYSKIIDDKRMFRSTYGDDEVYDNTEDQMMEDFTFGVAKRHLGVMISTNEQDALMHKTEFRKYLKSSWFSRLFK